MEEIVRNLNEFLCDLEVINVKLQNYHWNVEGKGFFITHEKLEEYYDEIRVEIDQIAEHILALGYQPLGTMQDFMKNSEIEEAKNEKIKTIPIVKNLIQDFEVLKQKAVKIKEKAEKQSDYATSALIDNYLANYSKKLWMLNETIK
ncbi:MAG: DNA starvation/stationary phase protection protein [Clostridia bacterium]|nr:DNA starvation/stationary phase protection protein [Clostridia bacterium]